MARVLRGRSAWKGLLKRGKEDSAWRAEISESVAEVLREVRARGDAALRDFARRFGDPRRDRFLLGQGEIDRAVKSLDLGSRRVIDAAAENIRAFAETAARSVRPVRLRRRGWTCGIDFAPVASAGCYVPAGRHPLPSSALMTVTAARAAGVPDVSVACPAPSPEVVYAAVSAGASRIYALGGAQAVAAFAFGTRTVEPVDVIAGPGNAYVTEAKRQVQGEVGIDMLAGPSEVAIIADSGADPELVALDALAQLEHDPDARAWVFTDDARAANLIASALDRLASRPGMQGFLPESAESAAVMVFGSLSECARASDLVAPEHLELSVADPWALKAEVSNYGALFLGYSTSVPLGDYAAGPNHTLPTGRTARFAGGLGPLTFMRARSWVDASGGAGRLARLAADFAAIEGLAVHGESALSRIPAERERRVR